MVNQVIGIDLGGTRIKGVLMDAETGQVLQQQMAPTLDREDGQWKTGVQQMVNHLKTFATQPIRGVGLAAPGLATTDNTAIASLPGRLQGLEAFDWAGLLGEPVRILNDAHAALLAEARFGAAQGFSHVLMLTLGTGVGGALLLDGKLYQGFMQRAGHVGHMVLNADSEQMGNIHMPGTLEEAIGNLTVGRRSNGRYQHTQALVEAYQQQEPLAAWVWLTSVRRLALAIASLINGFSPELILLGGGITQAGEALFTPMHTFLDIFEWRPAGNKTPIRQAQLQDWAGAIGAAAFLNDVYSTKSGLQNASFIHPGESIIIS